MLTLLKKLHIIHSWSKWKDIGKFEATYTHYHSGVEFAESKERFYRQERRCETCNLVEFRRVEL